MKKVIVISAFFCFSIFVAYAQIPDFVWARAGGGAANDGGYAVATDPAGNVYAAGVFSSDSVAFGSEKLYTSWGMKPALFLVKYDANGNVVWARSATGRVGYGIALATDPSGAVYVAGGFDSANILFDTITLNLDSTGMDSFIAKYDSNGNVLWANRSGGKIMDRANCLATDATGNVYMGGSFGLSFVFASDTLSCVSAYGDMFFAKYSTGGAELWAKSAGGIYSDDITSIATDITGNIYVAGQFQSTQLIIGNDTLNNAGQWWDSFLMKCDSAGNTIWAKNPGSVEDDMANSIAVDNSGNIFIAGSFRGPSINFGSVILVNSYTQYYDTYAAKYDGNGVIQWAAAAGGGSFDMVHSMCIDANSNVYITGFFESLSINFGSITLTRPGPNAQEVFLAGYDSNGNILWAKKGTGAGYDRSQSVACDPSGNIYIAGYFGGFSIVLGPQYITSSANGNHTEMFIAKLAIPVGLNDRDDENIISVYPNPTSGNFTMEVNPDVRNIQILNSIGQVITNTNYDGKSRFDYSLTDSGIYYIRITTSRDIITRRIAVCR